MNTTAQLAAVAALDLPFDLSSAEINAQFAADGTPIERPRASAEQMMARAGVLARAAMQQQLPLAA